MISRIKDRVGSKGINNDKAFIITILRIMKEFSYTYKEVLELPIPVYISIVDYINEIDKKRKEQNGKK